MAAGTANAVGFKNFASGIAPGDSEPQIFLRVTIPTTAEETIADRLNLLAFPDSYNLVGIDLLANAALDAHATPTLDADLFIVTGCEYATDAGTEAQVYNAGTRWQAASTTRLWIDYTTATAASAYNGLAYLRWKVVAAAATEAAGTITMIVHLQSKALAR